jgi:hypothetical protein
MHSSKFLSHPAQSRHLRLLKLFKDSEFAALQCPSAHPMVAFSGFYESNGITPSGDACGLAQTHCHGVDDNSSAIIVKTD